MSDLKAMYSTVRKDAFPETMTILLGDEKLVFQKRVWTLDGEEKGLRYGENPDQPAALYALKEGSITCGGLEWRGPGHGIVSAMTEAQMIQAGKHPGKTNLTDVDNGANMLQYLADPTDLLRAESEALLAGIVLDTKNFTMRTGGRTFEAAAFLRRAGADTSDVQRLFQSDLAGMVERYDIIRHAELVHGDIAVAAVEKEIDRVTAAKAADELLTLSGIHASFVLFKNGTGVNLSARSLGEINVQFIMEKLGGGGNSTTAGGQVADASVDEVRARLLAAIDEYMEE